MKYLNCGGEKTGRGRFVSRPYAGAGWAGAAGGLVSDVAQPKEIPYDVGDGEAVRAGRPRGQSVHAPGRRRPRAREAGYGGPRQPAKRPSGWNGKWKHRSRGR